MAILYMTEALTLYETSILFAVFRTADVGYLRGTILPGNEMMTTIYI